MRENIPTQEKIDQEYIDKMGQYIPQATLCSNIRAALTAELARYLAKDDFEQDSMPCAEFRKYISDSLEFDLRYRPSKRKPNSRDMDVSALQPDLKD